MAGATCFLLLALLPAALCLYGPLEYPIGLSDSAKYYILCQHNKLRNLLAKGELDSKWKRQPKAANMQCLCWCEELVAKAQKHASNCNGPPHDSRSERGTVNLPDVGQNVMQCMPSGPIDESLQAFLEEINGYDYETNTCDTEKAGPAKVCGHFTALMWAKTQCVGCAYDKCEGSTFGRLVCNYGPGGNIQGQKPYEQGEPCTKCNEGQSCLDGGLCCGCSGDKCGTNVKAASAEGCADVLPECPMYRDHPSVECCKSSSPYHSWAKLNCRKSCNFCGGIDTGKICASNFNYSSDHCSVHSSAGASECKTGNGLFYAGTRATTASSYECRNWAEATSYYHDFEFPERDKVKAKNYCRNPGSSGTQPWCYVQSNAAGVTWEYCSIPDC